MHNLLLQIVTQKKKDLAFQMKKVPLKILQKKVPEFPSRKKLFKRSIAQAENLGLIAEIKLASPTSGKLGVKEQLLERAKKYEQAGATAISLITEKRFFEGSTEFVQQIKKMVTIPILQKDFVIDAYQIYEAKSIGSDALLLIARLLDKETLKFFVRLCKNLGIQPVVEVYSEEDLIKAKYARPSIIAVNARNLETGEVNISNACALLRKVPLRFYTLGFSGIHSSREVLQYKRAGTQGVLVGTSLMKTKNISKFIKGL